MGGEVNFGDSSSVFTSGVKGRSLELLANPTKVHLMLFILRTLVNSLIVLYD